MPAPRCARVERAIVTGVGKDRGEWKWYSAMTASVLEDDGTWGPPFTGGADLFECLTRSGQRHRVKRIIPADSRRVRRE